MPSLKDRLLRIEQVCLNRIRQWWRPATCVGIAAGTVINLCVIPLATWTIPSLAEGAAWIAACATAFGVREIGKAWGTAE